MHSPARPLDVPPAQTGYDSDDEGEGEPGTTEAEELESAAEPLPPPRAWAARLPGEGSPDEEGSAGLDAPGPRLLDSYDTDPGGADTERRARRRALRRSIARGAGALLALPAFSGCRASSPHCPQDMTVADKDAAMLHITPDRLSWIYAVSCHGCMRGLWMTPDPFQHVWRQGIKHQFVLQAATLPSGQPPASWTACARPSGACQTMWSALQLLATTGARMASKCLGSTPQSQSPTEQAPPWQHSTRLPDHPGDARRNAD